MKIIELYYSDTCHDCHRVREMLLEMLPVGARFKEINISYPEGRQKAAGLGILSVPTVVIDGDIAIIGRATKEEIAKEIAARK